jgi:hypothetical protein
VPLLFQPVISQAADWKLVAADDDKEVEVDKQSAKPRKGAWFKYIHTPPKSESCGYGKKTGYYKNYVEANCKDFTIRTKQAIAYGEDEHVLEYCGGNTPKAEFTEFAPETLGEVYFNPICHAWGLEENRYATNMRRLKATKRQTEQAAGSTYSAGGKPPGAACNSSSECEGTLLCGKTILNQMRCMTSEEAWKSTN